MAKKHTAQCACGAVKFEFNTDPTFVAVCHCLDCKKSSGGEAATFFGVPRMITTSGIWGMSNEDRPFRRDCDRHRLDGRYRLCHRPWPCGVWRDCRRQRTYAG